MEYNFLYIDDADQTTAGGTVSGLQKEGRLKVTHQNPIGSWEAQRSLFLDGQFQENFHGLILDLRLEDFPNKENKKSFYKGPSLAQELRTLIKENALIDLPIILLSADEYLKNSFDKTGYDLFDSIMPKENLKGKVFSDFREELISLAEGYQIINGQSYGNKPNIISNLLNIDEQVLDVRFKAKMQSLLKLPSHEIATFIVKQLIGKNGILISEALLASRLGIDASKSEDWPKLLSILSDCSYKGVFAQGWNRWWMHMIDLWWADKFKDSSLRQIAAPERVDLLKRLTELNNIVPAEPLSLAKSNKFWTICAGTNMPLDTIDGLLKANQDHLYPWQDREYVSFAEAIDRTNIDRWKDISPLEKTKFDQIQTLNNRKRVRG